MLPRDKTSTIKGVQDKCCDFTGSSSQDRLDNLVQAGVVNHAPLPQPTTCENIGSTPGVLHAQMYTVMEDESGHYLQSTKQPVGTPRQHLVSRCMSIENSQRTKINIKNSVIPMEVCFMETSSTSPTVIWKQLGDLGIEDNQRAQQVSITRDAMGTT